VTTPEAIKLLREWFPGLQFDTAPGQPATVVVRLPPVGLPAAEVADEASTRAALAALLVGSAKFLTSE